MLTKIEKAYIAGFLDGDGCIMFQLVRRKDYIFGYQVRASAVFYQKTINRRQLEWLKTKLRHGYLRDRNDGMTEYTIVGIEAVKEVLKKLQPFIRLKKQHVKLAFKIFGKLPKRFTTQSLIAVGKLVDGFKKLNYSKKRQNTSQTLKDFFSSNRLVMIPRNDFF